MNKGYDVIRRRTSGCTCRAAVFPRPGTRRNGLSPLLAILTAVGALAAAGMVARAEPVDEVDCSVEASPRTLNVGRSVEVTVSVRLSWGGGFEGWPVTLRVTKGPNAGLRLSESTDSKGDARFSYSSDLSGTDQIETSGSISVGAFKCTTSVTWTGGLDLALVVPPAPWPCDVLPFIREFIDFTATVRSNGQPQAGVDVEFEVVSGPHIGRKSVKTTSGSSGSCSYRLVGDGLGGTDEVAVTIVGTSVSETAYGQWDFGYRPCPKKPLDAYMGCVVCLLWYECHVSSPESSGPAGQSADAVVLDAYRRVRDERLQSRVGGRRLTELYYRHSPEAIAIVVGRPELRERAAGFLEDHAAKAKALADRGRIEVTRAEIEEVDALLLEFGAAASEEMQRAIEDVRAILLDDRALEEFGVRVRQVGEEEEGVKR